MSDSWLIDGSICFTMLFSWFYQSVILTDALQYWVDSTGWSMVLTASLQFLGGSTIFTWVYHLTDWLLYQFQCNNQPIDVYLVELAEGENCEILFGIKVTCAYSCEVNTSLLCTVAVHLKDLCNLSLKNWYPTTVEFCTFNTTLPEMAVLTSKDSAAAKKLPSVELNLMITGSRIWGLSFWDNLACVLGRDLYTNFCPKISCIWFT